MSGNCGMSFELTIKFKFRRKASCALIVVPASSTEQKNRRRRSPEGIALTFCLQDCRAAEFRRKIGRENQNLGFAFAQTLVCLRRSLRQINLV